MAKSLIRKNQLHPDIADLISGYGSNFFVTEENLQDFSGSYVSTGVAFSGNRPISLNVAGFKDLIPGGNDVTTFLNNLFYPFQTATMSLTIQNTLVELGTTYSNVQYQVTINQNQATSISNLQLSSGASVVRTISSPSFGSNTYAIFPPLNLYNNTTLSASVTVNNNGSSTSISSSQQVNFIAPSWYGQGANGITTGVKNMSKYVNIKGSRSFIFNTTNNHFYYAYPNDWGLLSSIIDQNGFNITQSFSNSTGNLLLADGVTNYSYRIYQSITPSTNTNFSITFNF